MEIKLESISNTEILLACFLGDRRKGQYFNACPQKHIFHKASETKAFESEETKLTMICFEFLKVEYYNKINVCVPAEFIIDSLILNMSALGGVPFGGNYILRFSQEEM